VNAKEGTPGVPSLRTSLPRLACASLKRRLHQRGNLRFSRYARLASYTKEGTYGSLLADLLPLAPLRSLSLSSLVLAVFVLAFHSALAGQLEDARGVVVELRKPAARIVALSPALTEIVFAAGAGRKLVAAVRYSDYPEAARRLPQLGDASRVDLERLIALKPDLVLGWKSGNPPGDLARIARLGFPIFVSEPTRLDDVARLVRTVGALAGTREAAEESAAAFESEVDALRAQYAARRPVRVFYEIWHRPLLTVNGAHVISDVLALCGGVNVFASVPTLTPAVSLEAVAAAEPQAIMGGSSAGGPDALEVAWRTAPIAVLRDIPVRYVPPDWIQRQTPRIARGARAVCEALDAVRRGAR
jgi:iron complex transport system substrate-binding protein